MIKMITLVRLVADGTNGDADAANADILVELISKLLALLTAFLCIEEFVAIDRSIPKLPGGGICRTGFYA